MWRSDPRSQWIHLTAEGERVLAQVLSAWESAQEETVRLLGGDGVRAIGEMVDRVKKGTGKR